MRRLLVKPSGTLPAFPGRAVPPRALIGLARLFNGEHPVFPPVRRAGVRMAYPCGSAASCAFCAPWPGRVSARRRSLLIAETGAPADQ
jgi:hypothetical protein